MRQRFLLGTFNRNRYVDEYKLLYSSDDVYVESTPVDRTYQSAYSELMGMFPPGSLLENQKLTQTQLDGFKNGTRGMPPMHIRNAEAINSDLGRDPLPSGFVSVPVYSFEEPSMVDDISLESCEYVNLVDGYRYPANDTYTDYWYLCEDLKPAFQIAFDLPDLYVQEMSFIDCYNWADVVISREFEGVPLNYTYTEQELVEMNQTTQAVLTLPMADPVLARNMYVSKGLRAFLDSSEYIIFNNTPSESLPYDVERIKYVIYSAHDWTVAQYLLFLDAPSSNFTEIPFAALLVFELHSSENCTDSSCFWVEVNYEGVPQSFDPDCASPTQCTWDEFTALLTSKGFVTTTDEYETQCATPYTPTTTQRKHVRRNAPVKQ